MNNHQDRIQMEEVLSGMKESIELLTIAIGTMMIVLTDKGIITETEYNSAQAIATADLDQEMARQRDKGGINA